MSIDEYNGIINNETDNVYEDTNINGSTSETNTRLEDLQNGKRRGEGNNPVPQVDSRATEYGELSRRLLAGTQDDPFENASAERLPRDSRNLPTGKGQGENSVTFAPIGSQWGQTPLVREQETLGI